MELPRFPEFREVELHHKDAVKAFLHRHPLEASEYTFTNLFSYRDLYNFRISQLGNTLLVLSASPPASFFSPVGGELPDETLRMLFEYLEDGGGSGSLVRVPESVVDGHIERSRICTVQEERDHFDYVYDVRSLIELKGRKFHDKKNKVNRFRSSCEYTYSSLSADMIDECLEFEDYWCEVRECEKYYGLNRERCAILEMLRNLETLNLRGGIIRVDGKIAALTLGEKFLADTMVIHIEKAHADISGLYQAINQEFLMNEAGDCTFVNREQDLGIQGLRQSKLSYNPLRFVKKYRVDAEMRHDS